MHIEKIIAELSTRVIQLGEFSKGGKLWIKRSELVRAGMYDFAPMRAGAKRQQYPFDLGSDRVHGIRLSPPRKMNAHVIVPVGRTEPQRVPRYAADLSDPQMRIDVIANGAQFRNCCGRLGARYLIRNLNECS